MKRLAPSFREKVWGATHLEPLFPNSEKKIGEVWFEDQEDSPLLVKFLFTSDKLSVQVHPPGKTEMWYVLAAEPGAKVAAGFREPVSRERLKAASLSGEVEDLLEWFDAAPGDTFFLPAGTVHAIGAGLTLCEIQQNSDITYRLYDYGRPRELHLDQALAVSDLGPFAARQQPHDGVLVSCDYFVTELLRLENSVIQLPPCDRNQILIVIQGCGQIEDHPMKVGEAWSLPPSASPVELGGGGQFLRTAARFLGSTPPRSRY
jgi:mannose-6-phosphate isomerase